MLLAEFKLKKDFFSKIFRARKSFRFFIVSSKISSSLRKVLLLLLVLLELVKEKNLFKFLLFWNLKKDLFIFYKKIILYNINRRSNKINWKSSHKKLQFKEWKFMLRFFCFYLFIEEMQVEKFWSWSEPFFVLPSSCSKRLELDWNWKKKVYIILVLVLWFTQWKNAFWWSSIYDLN